MIRSGRMRSAVAHQVADRDLALALDVGRPRLERDHVRLLQLQLGRLLDRDDPLALEDRRRHRVEQRGLAGAGAARDHDVEPRPDEAEQQAPVGSSSVPHLDQLPTA